MSVSGVGVLDKAMAVIRALEDRPLHLAGLVQSTGFSRATTHRLVTALEVHGWARRDEHGRFVLGLALVRLGREAAEAFPLATTAEPFLRRLRDETEESVQLYVREGDTRVCVASLESPHGLRTIVPTGAVLDLHRGSAGHLLLEKPAALRRGWAESVAEREAGVASVSAPVEGPDGTVLAAVSVSGPIERLGRSPGKRFSAAVCSAAAEVSAQLSMATTSTLRSPPGDS